MSIVKRQDLVGISIILVLMAGFSFVVALVAALLPRAIFEDEKTRNQDQESTTAYSIPLGISKEEFIKKVGKPDYEIPSIDETYEQLVYETTLPYSSYLTAVVEVKTQRVIKISHGEDWKQDRKLEGYAVSEIRWDESKRPRKNAVR